MLLVAQRQAHIGDHQLAFGLQTGAERNAQGGGFRQVDANFDMTVVLHLEDRRAHRDHHVRLGQTARHHAVERCIQRALIEIALGAVACHPCRHRVGLQRFDGGRREDAFGEQGALACQIRLQLAQARLGLAQLQAVVGAIQLRQRLPSDHAGAFVDEDALDTSGHLE